ncbi:MAG: hypothetical protein EBR23_03270 [Planctomycetia bacterium]|nr:hypothetical protein [Planctomycetia bacterium]
MATTDLLVQLLRTLEFSPAMYLAESGIWSYPGDEALKSALADLVGDQKSISARAGAILENREVSLPRVAYPLSYTAWHDLDLRYLMTRVIDRLRGQAAECDALAAAAGDDAAAAELATEAMHSARRHADALEQSVARLRSGLQGAAPAGTGSVTPSTAS